MNKMMSLSLLLYLLFFIATTGWTQVERKEIGNLVIENIPEIPQQVSDRMLQYQNTRSATIQDWDATGEGMLISTRFAETTQIHYVEKPCGTRRQITFFNEPVGGADVCPDPAQNGFLFIKDVGGGEFYQIFYFDLNEGRYSLQTDGKSRNGSVNWSNKGDRFSYFSTARNGRDWDIYIGEVGAPGNARLVVKEGGAWVTGEWSPDDKRLLLARYVSANESYIYILDVASGKLTQINPSEEKIAYGGAVWSKNGTGIYFTSDENSEFNRLQYYDIPSGSISVLTGDISWDIGGIKLSPKGDVLAFIVNEGGIDKLWLLNTDSGKYHPVANIPTGQIYGLNFHPAGNLLAMVINTPQTPGDIYVMNLNDQSLERWTFSEVGGLNTKNFVTPELIHYPTFDQENGKPRMIPAFYYKPPKGDGPFPVLISIHGGPEGQYTPYFSSTVQYYVNEMGVAVLAPNVRGSSGYGKSYLQLDNGFKREESVQDIGKLLDWITEQPELDAKRVAVIGGSYGGYMVLASMIHFNDRLACGIDIVGISNFVTFLENTQDYRRDLRRVEYGDERDPEMRTFLNRISPTTNAHKISKPMFIAQGLNDPRVPVTESEQMVAQIRKNGGTVWYLLAKDEGHGFRKKFNKDYYTNAVVLFLEKFLIGAN